MAKKPKVVAITHGPSPNMQDCVRTYVGQTQIDCALARRQHSGYCAVLEECGADVVSLTENVALPDAVFVEDAAVVLDEIAIVGVMGAPSRRPESAAVEAELRKWRLIHRIELPATIDGGDVLRIGKTILIGASARTNAEGIDAFKHAAEPLGYRVIAVPLTGCLHLKSAVCALPDGTLIVNRQWIEPGAIKGFEALDVPPEEPWGANVKPVRSSVIVPANHPRVGELIARRGFAVHGVDISEFQKAEGGVSCLSLLVDAI
jgi:dimethylargininase